MTQQDEQVPALTATETAMFLDMLRADTDEPGVDSGQEAFIQRVMQDVMARQRRHLLLNLLPVMSGTIALLIAALVLLPDFTVLPTLVASALPELSQFSSVINSQSGTLLPLAALLLALLLPGLLDRVQQLLD